MVLERAFTTELEREHAKLVCLSICGGFEPPSDDYWRAGVDFSGRNFLDWYREGSISVMGLRGAE